MHLLAHLAPGDASAMAASMELQALTWKQSDCPTSILPLCAEGRKEELWSHLEAFGVFFCQALPLLKQHLPGLKGSHSQLQWLSFPAAQLPPHSLLIEEYVTGPVLGCGE